MQNFSKLLKGLRHYTKEEILGGIEFFKLKNRISHPDGHFDKAKRWYPDTETPSLKSIRSPSASYPYSYMTHCRTSKRVAELFNLEEKKVKEINRHLNIYLKENKLTEINFEELLKAIETLSIRFIIED